jgi:hypothetical protein
MGLMGRMHKDKPDIVEVRGRDTTMGDAVKKGQISCN